MVEYSYEEGYHGIMAVYSRNNRVYRKNYNKEISIEQLATIAHLSKYYYQRLFYRLVKKNVYEYVQLRRVAHSTTLLKETKKNILEVALECGFSNHGHFTKTFKKTYKMTPSQYRLGTKQVDHFVKPNLNSNYIIVDINVPLIVDGMVLEVREERVEQDITFIGNSKISLIDQIGESKPNDLVELWKQLPKGNHQVGVDILTLSSVQGYFDYFVGVEGKQKPEYQTRTMPKGKYIVCRYEAENFTTLVSEALYKASGYLYDVWLPKHQYTPDTILIQKYFHPFKENCYIELWAKIKE